MARKKVATTTPQTEITPPAEVKKTQPTAKEIRTAVQDYLTKFVANVSKEGSKLTPDKSLMDRVTYTMTNFAKATVKDLKEVANDVREYLTTVNTPAPVETSPKPSLKKSAAKPKTEKTAVDTIPPVTNVGKDNLPLASMFPKEIEHAEYGTLIATDKYQTWDELKTSLEEGESVFFVSYWTKRQIKEFGYAENHFVKVPKDGFPNDLDVMVAVLTCSTIDRVWCMSTYTEGLFRMEADDLTYVEDNDPRDPEGKKKFRVRVSAGMEYEIYVPKEA